MADKNPKLANQESPRTLTDDQIVTERKLPRRSFLTATGTLLVGGAAAIVAGARAVAQDAAQKAADPDAKKAADPDAKKGAKSGTGKKGTKKSKKTTKEAADPDAKPK